MNNENFVKLNNHPLLFVLAEFRFSDVRNIEEYIPKLQERFRKIFPFIEEKIGQEINLTPQGINISETKQWAFVNKDKSQAIILNYNRLVYMTADYDRFDGFKENCKSVINILVDEVAPSLLTRIGLRYADLIIKNNDEDITSYVQNSVCEKDFLSEIGNSKRQMKETLIVTDVGFLNIRSMYAESDISILNDNDNFPINIARKNEVSERILLDFDHFWQPEKEEDSLNFETDEIFRKLEVLHKPARQAFWHITTKTGRKIWE
ncbi:hypothetical protein LCGC14_1327290 [marine sediment metagenome]|jgi:uncharacterized protein (TIGR04255 family)|uniref:TIGR04255 family protein n=1 Tax=marine sediment metagenome TaxID=412755 RepID=A0A0F9KI85_9ZZZZ|nr:TIGR04255 family protein [Actinomycetota bacterium]